MSDSLQRSKRPRSSLEAWRALQGKEEALGPKHTSTLMTVNNLGNLYADQGKLGEAEKMYMRALQGREEALGPKHTSTIFDLELRDLLPDAVAKMACSTTW